MQINNPYAGFVSFPYLLLVSVHPQGFPAGSAEAFPSMPPNPDALTLGELKLAQLRSSRVNNEFLKMKPEDIVRGGGMYSIPSAFLISLLVMSGVLHRSSK